MEAAVIFLDTMKRLRVHVKGFSYPVCVGANILADAGPMLAHLGFDSPPVVVSNARILRLHGDQLLSSLASAFGPVPVVRIGDGERFKNHATLTKIYEGLFEARADRHSWIVALGGGVVGDIAGFSAATFMRGISYVNVPTTLLAQVDSSIGGKVGINVARGKNLIGAFYQPSAVLSDTATLRTLPSRELASGLYEVIKCGAIRSERLLRYLERNLEAVLAGQPQALEHVILASVRIKAEVVAKDERESGVRAILNFGHTVGHALEAATGFRKFKHGEAVAWGMIAAAGLASAAGRLRASEALRLEQLIHRAATLPSLRGISPARVWRALEQDKKSLGGRIRMVLVPGLGHAEVVEDLDASQLRRFITSFVASGGRH